MDRNYAFSEDSLKTAPLRSKAAVEKPPTDNAHLVHQLDQETIMNCIPKKDRGKVQAL